MFCFWRFGFEFLFCGCFGCFMLYCCYAGNKFCGFFIWLCLGCVVIVELRWIVLVVCLWFSVGVTLFEYLMVARGFDLTVWLLLFDLVCCCFI